MLEGSNFMDTFDPLVLQDAYKGFDAQSANGKRFYKL